MTGQERAVTGGGDITEMMERGCREGRKVVGIERGRDEERRQSREEERKYERNRQKGGRFVFN